MCDGHYYNDVRGTSRACFTPGPYHVSVEVVNIVNRNVKVKKISKNNLPYYKVHNECKKKKAVKVSDDLHNLIIDKMLRCNKLEYNPNGVYVVGYDSNKDLLLWDKDQSVEGSGESEEEE